MKKLNFLSLEVHMVETFISKFIPLLQRGEWGFQSPYWTDDMKDKLNVTDEDDGIFYMDFISFILEPKIIYSLRINQ